MNETRVFKSGEVVWGYAFYLEDGFSSPYATREAALEAAKAAAKQDPIALVRPKYAFLQYGQIATPSDYLEDTAERIITDIGLAAEEENDVEDGDDAFTLGDADVEELNALIARFLDAKVQVHFWKTDRPDDTIEKVALSET